MIAPNVDTMIAISSFGIHIVGYMAQSCLELNRRFESLWLGLQNRLFVLLFRKCLLYNQ